MIGGAPPLVVVTVPGRSAETCRAEVLEASGAGADVAEVRFDRWPDGAGSGADRLFPSPLPLLATLRSREEGGEGPADPASRGRWRAEVLQRPFRFIDLESARDASAAPDVLRMGKIPVLSSHLPLETSPSEVARRLIGSSTPDAIVKVVLPATVRSAAGPLLDALPSPGVGRFTLHTTGPSGPLLRAWSRRLGFALVFSSLPAGSTVAESPVEPAQIPVDRLAPFLRSDPPAPLFAVVGRPIAHSLSPQLHSEWMRAAGRPGLFVALEVGTAEELEEILVPLADGGVRGLSVTHPLKDAAFQLADRVRPGAEAVGCANMLTLDAGEVEAENTDLLAVLRRLEELKADGHWDGRRILVVGNGGAARATLAAANLLGAEASVLARSPERARQRLAPFDPVVADPGAAKPASVVVNATTVGRAEAPRFDVDLAPWLGAETRVLDFVYRADIPILEEMARQRGSAYEDGRRLLEYAAASTFERWWGFPPRLEPPAGAPREDA